MSAGAACPDHQGSFNPQPNNDNPQIPVPLGVRGTDATHQPKLKCEAVHE